jgi:UDP-3-O-[3-hydroxymyristoyl] glucosamine N-acyltransferase
VKYTLVELAEYLGVEWEGSPDHLISGLATLQSADSTRLGFIANPAYKKYLATTGAGAVILSPDLRDAFSGNKLLMSNPYLGFALLTRLFDQRRLPVAGVHPSAVVGENCQIAATAAIGPHAVLGNGVVVGEKAIIGPGCSVGDDCVIGQASELSANVTLYHGVTLGDNCLLHSGAVIGADGFGFAPSGGQWHKIHQLGGVILGNDVEIGANTTVDRGALANTEVADGVKIDNLVQIGHNVRLGKNTVIAANTAIAGSTTVGENCTIGGAVGIAGHLTIADKVYITGMSMVTNSVTEPGSYSSGTPLASTTEWRKNAVRFRQLDALAARLKQLEKDKKL